MDLRESLLDRLPVGFGIGVREDVSIEHPHRASKPCQRIIIHGAVDDAINSGKALCSSQQRLTSFLEIPEELVISADIS